MEWLRLRDYNDINWNVILGPADYTWLAYAKAHKMPILDRFPDPLLDRVWQHPSHMAAAMNSVYLMGPESWKADMGGWAGDLFQFYANWLSDLGNYPLNDVNSGYRFCLERLARIEDGKSNFLIRDLEEDADGFNIAMTLRRDRKAALDAVADRYFSPPGGDSSYSTRFVDFYKDRFGGTIAGATDEACRLLTTKDSQVLRFARWYITGYSTPPAELDPKVLRRFCEGFATVLDTLAKKQAPTPAQPAKKPWILHVNTEGGKLAYNENPVLINNLKPSKLLLRASDGKKTVNTKCINIIDTAGQQTSNPAHLGGLNNALPKGYGLYFGYETNEDLNGKPRDTCVLNLFDSEGCIQKTGKPVEGRGIVATNLPFTAFSFRMWNCSLLFDEI